MITANGIWYNGTINARELGSRGFVSTDIQKERLRLIRNNPEYRERLENAQKLAGYEDKLMIAARGSVQQEAVSTLFKHSEKAEAVTKQVTEPAIEQSNIILSK